MASGDVLRNAQRTHYVSNAKGEDIFDKIHRAREAIPDLGMALDDPSCHRHELYLGRLRQLRACRSTSLGCGWGVFERRSSSNHTVKPSVESASNAEIVHWRCDEHHLSCK